ncbi:hypothetical protein ACLB2K_029560 [Fragaria x ananassa]
MGVSIAGASLFWSHNSAVEAEAKAFFCGVKMVVLLKLLHIIVEGDCQEVIKALNDFSASRCWRISLILKKVTPLVPLQKNSLELVHELSLGLPKELHGDNREDGSPSPQQRRGFSLPSLLQSRSLPISHYRMSEAPFRPREQLAEKQKYFQGIHKHTYLKGPFDKVTSVAIPAALAATSLFLIGRGIYNMSHGIGKKE